MRAVRDSKQLTHDGVLAMLQAGVAKSESIGVPECIVVVDASGVVLGEIRMNRARFLSRRSARAKALTAASINGPSHQVPEAVRLAAAAATDGGVTGLPGGLPVRFGGVLVGGIGVGSGSGEEDLLVARAALEAVGADHID